MNREFPNRYAEIHRRYLDPAAAALDRYIQDHSLGRINGAAHATHRLQGVLDSVGSTKYREAALAVARIWCESSLSVIFGTEPGSPNLQLKIDRVFSSAYPESALPRWAEEFKEYVLRALPDLFAALSDKSDHSVRCDTLRITELDTEHALLLWDEESYSQLKIVAEEFRNLVSFAVNFHLIWERSRPPLSLPELPAGVQPPVL